MVTAIFYLTGWQLGGVEAISLSILVGTSVDYSFHLVEGYILAGNAVSSTVNNKVTFHFSLSDPFHFMEDEKIVQVLSHWMKQFHL